MPELEDLLRQYEELTGEKISLDRPKKPAPLPDEDKQEDVVTVKQRPGYLLSDYEMVDLDAKRSRKVDIMDSVVDLDAKKQGREKVYAKKVSFSTEPRINTFKDIKDVPKDKFDEKVRTETSLAEREQIKRRPPAKKYKISCDQCNKTCIIDDPGLIPPIVGDDSPAFYCERCLKRRR